MPENILNKLKEVFKIDKDVKLECYQLADLEDLYYSIYEKGWDSGYDDGYNTLAERYDSLID